MSERFEPRNEGAVIDYTDLSFESPRIDWNSFLVFGDADENV